MVQMYNHNRYDLGREYDRGHLRQQPRGGVPFEPRELRSRRDFERKPLSMPGKFGKQPLSEYPDITKHKQLSSPEKTPYLDREQLALASNRNARKVADEIVGLKKPKDGQVSYEFLGKAQTLLAIDGQRFDHMKFALVETGKFHADVSKRTEKGQNVLVTLTAHAVDGDCNRYDKKVTNKDIDETIEVDAGESFSAELERDCADELELSEKDDLFIEHIIESWEDDSDSTPMDQAVRTRLGKQELNIVLSWRSDELNNQVERIDEKVDALKQESENCLDQISSLEDELQELLGNSDLSGKQRDRMERSIQNEIESLDKQVEQLNAELDDLEEVRNELLRTVGVYDDFKKDIPVRGYHPSLRDLTDPFDKVSEATKRMQAYQDYVGGMTQFDFQAMIEDDIEECLEIQDQLEKFKDRQQAELAELGGDDDLLRAIKSSLIEMADDRISGYNYVVERLRDVISDEPILDGESEITEMDNSYERESVGSADGDMYQRSFDDKRSDSEESVESVRTVEQQLEFSVMGLEKLEDQYQELLNSSDFLESLNSRLFEIEEELTGMVGQHSAVDSDKFNDLVEEYDRLTDVQKIEARKFEESVEDYLSFHNQYSDSFYDEFG